MYHVCSTHHAKEDAKCQDCQPVVLDDLSRFQAELGRHEDFDRREEARGTLVPVRLRHRPVVLRIGLGHEEGGVDGAGQEASYGELEGTRNAEHVTQNTAN